MDHQHDHQQDAPERVEDRNTPATGTQVPRHGQRPGGDHDGRAAGGHDKHAGHSVAMFRDKFWLTLALTIPVVILSPVIEEWFGYSLPTFPGEQYAAAILGTIIFFYRGLVFIRGAQGERPLPAVDATWMTFLAGSSNRRRCARSRSRASVPRR